MELFINSVGDLNEKVLGSLGEAASKVIESTGHTVKDSTTGISNMFHGIVGGIGDTIRWCHILTIIVVLLYISHFTLLKLCRRKPSGLSNAPTTPLPTPSTNSDLTRNRPVNPASTNELPPNLPLVLASFTLQDVFASQERIWHSNTNNNLISTRSHFMFSLS